MGRNQSMIRLPAVYIANFDIQVVAPDQEWTLIEARSLGISAGGEGGRPHELINMTMV